MIKDLIYTIIKHKLNFDAFLVLYSLHLKDKDIIYEYATKCKKINTDIFRSLESDGLINIDDPNHENKITFESLSLTEQGTDLIERICTDNESALRCDRTLVSVGNFDDFRNYYLKTAKDGFRKRPLHGNLKRCKRLYEKLLLETTHEVLCKCAEIYTNEHIRSGDQIYMQNLETWLSKRTYESYLEDIKDETNTINTQSEDI